MSPLTTIPGETDHPDVITWPPLLFLGHAIVSGALHWVSPIPLMRSGSIAIGAGLALTAGALALWAERAMSAAGTNVRPDRPTTAIVSNGPYRFTRNPMYLALCLLQLAVGFLLNDWMPLLFTLPLAATLHFGVILREEMYLERKFGEPYLAYRRRVRRWL